MTTRFTDTFIRANGALGSSWTSHSDNTTAFAIVSNTAQPTTFVSGDAGSMVATSVYASPNDQWAQATVNVSGAGGGSGFGLFLRSDSSGNGYRVVGGDAGGTNNIELIKIVSGGGTHLSGSTQVLNPGDVLYFEVQGANLLVKVNGTTITALSVSDSSLTTGQPGIAYSSTAASGSITAFTSGDFSGGSGPTLAQIESPMFRGMFRGMR
jgi:hypothetical protein